MHPVLASTLIPLAAALWGCGDPCAEQVDAAFLDAAAAVAWGRAHAVWLGI